MSMSVVVVVLAVFAVMALVAALTAWFRLAGMQKAAVAHAAEVERLQMQIEQERALARAGDASGEQRIKDLEASSQRRLADLEAGHRRHVEDLVAGYRRQLEDQEAVFRKRLEEKDAACSKFTQQAVETLRVQFAALAQEKLKASSEGLSEMNQKSLTGILAPYREQLEQFRKAFVDNLQQQVANKASFEQAISDLGNRALKIGAEAENLAKALKNESKTQGDWGEMVLSNILSAAGLREGFDFFPQAQEVDEFGNRLIPDVEIPLPNKEKLLVDSKASITAYLDYVAAADDAAREEAVKAHLSSVRKHMEELADKDYIKKVKGAQGYILMFIPNEGSYLLAMERDRRLAMDAFRRHVIIVNPTTLLLCLQIVALLRSREAQNENAEKISAAAAKMYEKFATFSVTFTDIGKRLDGLAEAYKRAHGQLCEGNANVVKQLESLKDMGVVTSKTIHEKILGDAGVGG